MSQLTITSFYVRRAIKIGTICLLTFIVLRAGYAAAYALWLYLNPPKDPPPAAAYGRLPPVNFPEQKISIPVNFQLETVEGKLPTNFGDRAKVIYLTSFGGKFSKLDDAQAIANRLELNVNRTKISENVYLYNNRITRTQLEINVLTKSFVYAYDYIYDQTLINPPPLPTKEEAVRMGETFLRQFNLFSKELAEGGKEVSYWSIKGEKLVPAISASEADFVRVSFFRTPVDQEYPIMPPTYPEALVSFLISSRRVQGNNIVEAKYTHFERDPEEFSEYPLLPIEAAWEEVTKGNYYLASFDGNSQEGVKIRKIYLAYFDPSQPTNFLQPIYVFEGDDNFVGYHTAIPPEWVQPQ